MVLLTSIPSHTRLAVVEIHSGADGSGIGAAVGFAPRCQTRFARLRNREINRARSGFTACGLAIPPIVDDWPAALRQMGESSPSLECFMDFVGFPLQSILSTLDDTQASRQGKDRRDDRITLILDTKGCIQYCSEPALFASAEQALHGQPVTAVIPSLPFRSKTPGYNVAYTRFAFDNDRWHRHSVKLGDGQLAPMDLMVRAIPVNHGYCLLVLLKPVSDGLSENISARKPQLRYVPSSEAIRVRQRETSDADFGPEPCRQPGAAPLRVASGWS